MSKTKKIVKKKKVSRKVHEDLCCICKKPSEISLPHPNDMQLRIGLCDRHWADYSELGNNEAMKAFKEKHFHKEIVDKKES